MRLSPEREAEIRRVFLVEHFTHYDLTRDLLAEIDALRERQKVLAELLDDGTNYVLPNGACVVFSDSMWWLNGNGHYATAGEAIAAGMGWKG